MRLLVTRPQPDGSAQAKKLAELGHEAVVAPLAEIEFLDPGPLSKDDLQAVIVTSRNALRAMQGHPDLDGIKDIPLFAVGSATARLAQEMGFARVTQGGGTAALLAPQIGTACTPEKGAMLHLAGERLAGDLKGALQAKGFTVRQPVVYRSVAAERLPHEAITALEQESLDGVILMSPETARVYASLIRAHGLENETRKITCFCLSRAVGDALESLPGLRTRVADAPTQDDLLALIGPDTAN